MVVEQSNIDHIMRGLQSTEGVRLHNHRKKLRQRFDIIKKLGQGTYGKVQLGINKETGQEVAIKTIKKCKIETEADLIRIRREIQIMSSVRHPNIIHIYEVFENREKMVLVMEYAAGGELYDYLNERKVLEENEARRIFRQISTAVYYCHKHKICHRDLKLENILLDEHGSAKIADFGLSNVYEDKRLLQTFCGSPLYASPEIVRGTPYKGPEVDCWSLGVLLYTLVYGAMPFDGSNFKRLVKQISNGEYYEPKKPKTSPASPLIREMLTVDPVKRSSIEQICGHAWVNQGFNVSCLDIAEDLANQTPVRLDLLLSLAPPPENSEKLVVTDDQAASVQEPPPRSMSVGSLLELHSSQEDRRLELLEEKVGKRKLEPAPSDASMTKSLPKKKEVVEAIDVNATEAEVAECVAVAASDMEVEVEGAAALPSAAEPPKPESTEAAKPENKSESISSEKPTRKSVKTVKKKVTKDDVKKKKSEPAEEKKIEEKPVKKDSSRASVPKEEVGKEIKREGSTRRSREVKANLKLNLKKEREKSEPPTPEEVSGKVTERRKSKIFETAEKFMSPEPKSPTVEKPKKVFIPGVKVSDFAKAFERKSSIPTSTAPLLKSSPSKKTVPKEEKKPTKEETPMPVEENKVETVSEKSSPPPNEPTPVNDEKIVKLKDSARNIIANALNEEERKKVKKQILKPPVPKQKSEDKENLDDKKMTLQIGNEKAVVEVHSPVNTKFLFEPDKPPSPAPPREDSPKEKKTAKVNITLKSNTLPRRTTKAEIQLSSPSIAPVASNNAYRTEVEHRVGDNNASNRGFHTQRSEVAFPVSAAQKSLRSVSLEPESRRKERIIPIHVEDKVEKNDEERDRVTELERQDSLIRGRPPTLPYQRTLSQRSTSLSRQSTQDSDTESTMSTSGDPIKKSPREFIIPIAVEGGGYVTPRATSLEPSESMSKRRPAFPRRISMFSDAGSEDETSWRHDLDEPFRLHRLRSSRAAPSERADSLSGSEDDEDDGFELLTAENLFSTLLSRVQNLTQRLNVDHGGRPGFPSARLSSQRLFSNFHEPLTRLSERSLSREMDGLDGRWPRGPDVSHSIRSVPRDRSRGRHEKDETLGNRLNGRKSTHRSQSDRIGPAFHRQWSDRGPSRTINDCSPVVRPKEGPSTDFYDILAEKYGVVPCRRYDTEPRRRSHSREPRGESLMPDAESSEVKPKPEVKKDEKHQTPSEKLAAVLNQLGDKGKAERGIPNELLYPKKEKPKNRQTEFIKIENDRLKDLSPKALELYEKTLGLYQKTVTDKKRIKEGTEAMRDDRKFKQLIPRRVDKENTPSESLKTVNSEGESGREDSPSISKKLIRRLSRELENEIKDDVVRRKTESKPDNNLLKRLSKELEKEMNEVGSEEPEQIKQTARTKIFSTLDKKLDKLRPVGEKKYVDKAIRSLRESSVGPKEIVSENVLIKRAVSSSNCSEPGTIQSTVNSMLNFFKKPDPKEVAVNLVESTPPMLTPEGSPSKEAKNSPNSKESPSRLDSLPPKLSDSSSFVSRDSESFDSWSNCSDFGNPDDLTATKPISPVMRNYADGPSESVGERIRRKSFYSRFNERRRSRKSSDRKSEGKEEIPVYKKSITQNLDKSRSPQPYTRSSTSTDYTRKWYDDSRPRPFYKSEITAKDEPYRKTSLDWSKTFAPPSFARSQSQTSSSSLPRSFVSGYDGLRRPPIDPDRPFSPTRLGAPGRLFSPRASATPSPTMEL